MLNISYYFTQDRTTKNNIPEMKSFFFPLFLMATTLASCENKSNQPTCTEWSPQCELQKDYVYFQIDSILNEVTTVDGLGFPLREGSYYIMSTRSRAPIATTNPARSTSISLALSQGTARDTVEILKIDGGAIRVHLYMFGKNEIRPSEALEAYAGVVKH